MGMKRWDPEPAPERFGQLPRSRGVIFVCQHCTRPTATNRDAVLRAWGDRGVIKDVAAKLRCRNCKKRGMRAYLTPYWLPNSGSKTDLDALADQIGKLKPPKWID